MTSSDTVNLSFSPWVSGSNWNNPCDPSLGVLPAGCPMPDTSNWIGPTPDEQEIARLENYADMGTGSTSGISPWVLVIGLGLVLLVVQKA